MGAFEWKSGEDLSSGNKRCQTKGWYHIMITTVEMPAKNKDGTLMTGVIGVFTGTIFAGTDESQKGKECRMIMKQPDLSMKDQGKFVKEKFDRFLLACSILKPGQTNTAVQFDESHVLGKQMIVSWDSYISKSDGKTYWDV